MLSILAINAAGLMASYDSKTSDEFGTEIKIGVRYCFSVFVLSTILFHLRTTLLLSTIQNRYMHKMQRNFSDKCKILREYACASNVDVGGLMNTKNTFYNLQIKSATAINV